MSTKGKGDFINQVLLSDSLAEDGGDGLRGQELRFSSTAEETDKLVSLPRATEPRPYNKNSEESTLFLNRELSWLDFNWRVLFQALDPRIPVLERVKFVAITANNLDEFVRKRVGGLKRQVAAGVLSRSPDGRTPQEQLDLIRQAMRIMHVTLTRTWEERLKPMLSELGLVQIRDIRDLNQEDLDWLREYFHVNIFPILTPLAVDPGHPFPFISNQSLSLAVQLINPEQQTTHFARLKVPLAKGRWVQLPDGTNYVPIEQVIATYVQQLFRGMEVVGVHAFRITRNADVTRDEEEADDLLAMISEELRERRFASVVRLEIDKNAPEAVKNLLQRELNLDDADVYAVDGLLDLAGCMKLSGLDFPEHRYPEWTPIIPFGLRNQSNTQSKDIFGVIREHDLLVHHPYESFHASVQRFIEEAVNDPAVLAIKQTLYRTSEESPIVAALMRAAEKGKQVAVLVEVKARFDEQNNIEWGRKLEDAGVHVTYGLVGLKTHCKTTLVIREEEDGLRSYCHIGTGNYNATTARLYTDVGLFTASPTVGYDVINLFHYLTGFAPQQSYDELVVAPNRMRKRFIDNIRREAAVSRSGGHGAIVAKMNAIDDVEIIHELYKASQAGVQISLIIRGHCRLRPGIPGISDNISVISILGRFLEHSRIYYFENSGEPEVYMSSGDWQRRNLDDRVEAAIRVDDEFAREKLIEILLLAITDRRESWELREDGRYVQRIPSNTDEEEGFQEHLMRKADSGYHVDVGAAELLRSISKR
ncbi:MAG: polyphosphate kinase 1 [Rhodothermales bacterium]|nr:polyphosphate kinase 1 [Rhodothermales bacterium]